MGICKTSARTRSASLAKQQRREVGQVTPPEYPAMPTRSFNSCMLHTLRFEPCSQVAVERDQMIVSATGDPQKMELLVCLCIQRRKVGMKVFRNSTGAEGANPGKLIEVVQARQQ